MRRHKETGCEPSDAVTNYYDLDIGLSVAFLILVGYGSLIVLSTLHSHN